MSEPRHLVIEDGRASLRFVWSFQGGDLRLHISGGDDHIGAAALAESGPDGSRAVHVWSRKAHREEALTRQAAEELHAAVGGVVCVTAGIHIDDASPEEINAILRNFSVGLEQVISIIYLELKEAEPPPA